MFASIFFNLYIYLVIHTLSSKYLDILFLSHYYKYVKYTSNHILKFNFDIWCFLDQSCISLFVSIRTFTENETCLKDY